MKRLWAQVWALVLLGVQAVILQPLRRLRLIGTSDEARFLGAYSPDRLLPLSSEELENRFRFSGCIHCGLCDVTCEALAHVRRRDVASLSGVVIGASRSMPDYSFVRSSVERLAECEGCERCEAACPTGVPIGEIIADVRRHAALIAGRVEPSEASAGEIDDERGREAGAGGLS